MKNKGNIKLFVGIIVGALISAVGVYAAVTASSITYSNTNSGLKDASGNDVTNVQGAIDALTVKANRKFEDGEVVYFNPITNSKCTNYVGLNSNTGYKGETTTTQNGCMKWYTFLDSADASTVKMILDHNTTEIQNWNATGANGINYAYEDSNVYPHVQALVTTSGWSSSLNPTIISAKEIADIQGYTNPDGSEWTNTANAAWCFGSTEPITSFTANSCTKAQGTNQYAWLYDNLGFPDFDCTGYGCNTNNTTATAGYWTRTTYGEPESGSQIWDVHRFGNLGSGTNANATWNGIRPVITVAKSKLK